MDKQSALKQIFGYSGFRQGQGEIIDALLAGQDVLAVMPTGAGKSICYQIPALLLPGITLVISPLISLMKDQVTALNQAGVKAAYFNSSLTARQYALALERAKEYAYKIIYVAPERLTTPGFLAFVQQVEISLVTVDEAHCVSQWGQDFRPGYLGIAGFIQALPNKPVVGAFTATATRVVREDIMALLQLQEPFTLTTGFDRENLHFAVSKPRNKTLALLDFMRQNSDASGIVYCATRKNVETVCVFLNANGFAATRYHAGLADAERHQNQEDFLHDRQKVMVATNAFGMGIDKSNVSFVVHYNMPKNLESYYQEAGRAGRDGEPAHCLLLYSPQDVRTNQFLIEHSNEDNETLSEEVIAKLRQNDLELLKKMTWYCTTTDCLRRYILQYFGETASIHCDNCSNCNTEHEFVDITVNARAAVACVQQMELLGRRYGKTMVANVLKGSDMAKIQQNALNRLPAYGSLTGVPLRTVMNQLDYLLEAGYLAQTGDEYPVVCTTELSATLAGPEVAVQMRQPKTVYKPEAVQENAALPPADNALLQELKKLRMQLARTSAVPAYVIFTDASLHDMCRKKPANNQEFLAVSGVGEAKLNRYGKVFLHAIEKYKQENM